MNEQVMLILSGLQGSGKSTFAKRLLKESPDQWVRINWDTQRRLTPGYKFSKQAEKQIRDFSYMQVRDASALGKSVVIDNTNLTDESIGKWARLGSELGMHVRVQTFDTPIEDCIRRDAERTGDDQVGRAVIERAALWNSLIKFPQDRKIVIVDVDGTLADCSHRRATKEKRCPVCGGNHIFDQFNQEMICSKCRGSGLAFGIDWATFYRHDLMELDTPRYPVVEWARALYGHYTVLIVSGRPCDKAGKSTVNWLRKHEIEYDHIFMRNGGDQRDDTIVKQEILNKILDKVPVHQIAFCIDDRNRVVDQWRKNGIKCYQVVSREEGDF